MVATGETEDPQTNDLLGGGLGHDTDNAITEALYNFVSQDWVDYNVPVKEDPVYEDAGGTWSGTLDQDLASLFQLSGATGGGGDTGMPNGPYLGIDQVLDQGLAYLQGNHSNPFPGDILDTSIRNLYGDAQRIVQIFSLANTIGRSSTGIQVRGTTAAEGAASVIHQWVADWMRDTNTNTTGEIGGGNEDTADGTVTWTLETLLSSSFWDPAGTELIHQVNDQYSVYSANWSAGNSVTNNPLNAQADLGVGQMVVGHSLSMEFWEEQSNIIPYDETIVGHTSASEEVISNIPIHDGDHNPLNN
jgi:hypothetical protein